MDLDLLYAAVGRPVSPGVAPRGSRRRTRYELEVEARALESLKVQSSQDWGVKAHHAFDLDPIRDEDPEEVDPEEVERQLRRQLGYERVMLPAQAINVKRVFIRVEEEDITVFDGVPSEVLRYPDRRPFKGAQGRSLVAAALRRKRNGLSSTAYALAE